MEDWIRTEGDSLYIDIKVIPGASKNEIAGIRDNRLCVKIASVPQDGRANDSLRGFFAKTFDCAKRDVVLMRGEKSRLKTVAVPAACGEKIMGIV